MKIITLGWLGMMAFVFSMAAETFDFPVTRPNVYDNEITGSVFNGTVQNMGDGRITHVAVSLKLVPATTGDMMFNGDYYAYLLHNGKRAVLLNRVGTPENFGAGYANNGFDITLDDAAANGDAHVYQLVAPDPIEPLTGVWAPDGRNTDPIKSDAADLRTKLLDQFNGETADGQWSLFIADMSAGGVAKLAGWGLHITVEVPTNHHYTLTTSNIGSGEITIDPALTNYVAGTNVELRAVSGPGYVFVGWEGDLTGDTNPATLVISSNTTVAARFKPAPVEVGQWIVPEETRLGRKLTTNQVASLIYRLDGPVPDGMELDPGTSLLTWIPNEEQGPSTNLVTFTIQDRIVPELVVTNQFEVIVPEVNRPPALGSIADRTITAGDTLTIPTLPSDPDLPENQLSFMLVDGPPGSGIDSTSGVFTWISPVTNPATNYLVKVAVNDDGIPSLRAIQSFTVTVLSTYVEMRITAQRLGFGNHTLQVTSTPGRDYALQASTNLVDWTDIFQTNAAPAQWEHITTNLAPTTLYRVRLQP